MKTFFVVVLSRVVKEEGAIDGYDMLIKEETYLGGIVGISHCNVKISGFSLSNIHFPPTEGMTLSHLHLRA